MLFKFFIEGYDSDVAREKSIDYSTKTYANPIRQSSGLKPNQRDYDDNNERYVVFRSKQFCLKSEK